MKKVLITGITGQLGSYISEIFLEKGYEVHGIIRRCSSFNTSRIDHIFDHLHLHYGDLTDSTSIDDIVGKIEPEILIHSGAMSHVKVSFEIPQYTLDSICKGTLAVLEAVRKRCPHCKIVNFSTSEMYGGVDCPDGGYDESSLFYPKSPYGVAKLYAHWIAKNYRESYYLSVRNSINFNYESPRRLETFVTRKITKGLSNIFKKKQESLCLGNISSFRNWSHAQDIAYGNYLLSQKILPQDYVFASGETHSVRYFVECCCAYLDIDLAWEGEGEKEIGIDTKTNKTIIKIDPKYYRPAEVNFLLGNPSKAQKELDWQPKYSFEDLVSEMLENDLHE